MRTTVRRVDLVVDGERSTVMENGGSAWPDKFVADEALALPFSPDPQAIVEVEDATGQRMLVRYRAVDAMVL